MLELVQHEAGAGRATDIVLSLTFEQRQRGRARVRLDDGREAGLFLTRGTMLRDGDLLTARDGSRVRVQAAAESVSTVRTDDPLALARLCYHLGNRHVSLQIAQSCVRYRHDHVLDDMVRNLGLEPLAETAPFEPEAGAYHGHTHSDADKKSPHSLL